VEWNSLGSMALPSLAGPERAFARERHDCCKSHRNSQSCARRRRARSFARPATTWLATVRRAACSLLAARDHADCGRGGHRYPERASLACPAWAHVPVARRTAREILSAQSRDGAYAPTAAVCSRTVDGEAQVHCLPSRALGQRRCILLGDGHRMRTGRGATVGRAAAARAAALLGGRQRAPHLSRRVAGGRRWDSPR
jgi:hypothetical protein